jgi:quinol monooxygenase YgiN
MELFIFVRLHARTGNEDAVAAALRGVVAPSRAEAGCLGIHAFRATVDPQLFYIHSRWKMKMRSGSTPACPTPSNSSSRYSR